VSQVGRVVPESPCHREVTLVTPLGGSGHSPGVIDA